MALEGGWARCSPTRLYLVLALEEAYGGKVTAGTGVCVHTHARVGQVGRLVIAVCVCVCECVCVCVSVCVCVCVLCVLCVHSRRRSCVLG